MSSEDKKWLLEEFSQYENRTMKGEVLDAYHRAEMILLERTSIRKRTCSCEYGSLKRNVDRLYGNFKTKTENS